MWIVLAEPLDTVTGAKLGWIHLVALGWFTVTAFSILLHAIPAFLDVDWKLQGAARVSLAVLAAAIGAFVAAFIAFLPALGTIATVLGAAMAVYLFGAWSTLAQAFRSEDRVDRAVARAFFGTLVVLALVALMGIALAWMLSGAAAAAWIARLPYAHANLALFGWLTLLVYGVSARTLRPITGTRSRWPLAHVAVGTSTLLGAIVLPLGLALGVPTLADAGAVLIGLGGVCYIADTCDILRRATNVNRPPQIFVAAALCWLAVALVAGAALLLGAPLQPAYVFAVLLGWIAQMVNGHIFHIGVRLIATVYRGDDDETPPEALLDRGLVLSSFGFFQMAVALVLAGLVLHVRGVCFAGAILGFSGWASAMRALAGAVRSARYGVALG